MMKTLRAFLWLVDKLKCFGVCPPHSRGVACVNGQVYIEVSFVVWDGLL